LPVLEDERVRGNGSERIPTLARSSGQLSGDEEASAKEIDDGGAAASLCGSAAAQRGRGGVELGKGGRELGCAFCRPRKGEGRAAKHVVAGH
jgi:hypothetical protein